MSYYGSGSGEGGYYGQQNQQQQYGGQNERQQYSGGGASWQQQQQPPQHVFQQTQYQQGFMPQQQQQQQHQYVNNSPVTPATTTSTAMPSLWNPATAATMAAMAASTVAAGGSINNDAMLDLASTAGKSFLQSGTARMVPGLESSMMALRSYFAVDNKYVVRKMKRVLFPILSDKQGWQRQVRQLNFLKYFTMKILMPFLYVQTI